MFAKYLALGFLVALGLSQAAPHHHIAGVYEAAFKAMNETINPNKETLVIVDILHPRTWTEARDECEKQSGTNPTLFEALTHEESTYLAKIINDNKNNEEEVENKYNAAIFWVGLGLDTETKRPKWVTSGEQLVIPHTTKGSSPYSVTNYEEVTNPNAWASPNLNKDEKDKIVYEYVPANTKAQGFICQRDKV